MPSFCILENQFIVALYHINKKKGICQMKKEVKFEYHCSGFNGVWKSDGQELKSFGLKAELS